MAGVDVGTARLVCEELFEVTGRALGDGERERVSVLFLCTACGGRGGRGRSIGAGSDIGAILFEFSHSGTASVPIVISKSEVCGTRSFELRRSGIADAGSFSNSFRKAIWSISTMSSEVA